MLGLRDALRRLDGACIGDRVLPLMLSLSKHELRPEVERPETGSSPFDKLRTRLAGAPGD